MQFTIDDLEHLAYGSAVLGSGGGGNPFHIFPMVHYQLQKFGPVEIRSLQECDENDLIVPLSSMGAPLICTEKLQNGKEFLTIVEQIEKKMGRKPTALVAAEMGGANAFTPFLIAGQLGLPIVDADMIGRAFPELHMSTCYLAKIPLTPAFQADSLGNNMMIEAKTAEALERIARAITVAVGSSSAIAFYLMNGPQAQKGLIPGTLSQAIQIGKILKDTSSADPIQSFLDKTGAIKLAEGVLTDTKQVIRNGFLQGKFSLSTKQGKIQVSLQNEYLTATLDDKPLATTPDIIMIMDKTSGTPITSESLRYGLQVILVALPAPKIWKTKKGLSLVGPKAFGYSYEYKPIGG